MYFRDFGYASLINSSHVAIEFGERICQVFPFRQSHRRDPGLLFGQHQGNVHCL